MDRGKYSREPCYGPHRDEPCNFLTKSEPQAVPVDRLGDHRSESSPRTPVFQMRHTVVRSAGMVSAMLVLSALPLAAQQASFVYRLGKDTVAIEQYARTGNRISGEMVQRSGAAVLLYRYELSMNAGGQPTAATIRRFQADGTPFPNQPSEARLTFTADSVVREIVRGDGSSGRTPGCDLAGYVGQNRDHAALKDPHAVTHIMLHLDLSNTAPLVQDTNPGGIAIRPVESGSFGGEVESFGPGHLEIKSGRVFSAR